MKQTKKLFSLMLILLVILSQGCKKDILLEKTDKTIESLNFTDLQKLVSKEFPNVTLQKLDPTLLIKEDTTNIPKFGTPDEYLSYLRRNMLAFTKERNLINSNAIKLNAYMSTSRVSNEIMDDTGENDGIDFSQSATLVTTWSTNIPIPDFGGYSSIGISAIVTYKAKWDISPFTGNYKCYKQIISVTGVIGAGGIDMSTGLLPGDLLNGSTSVSTKLESSTVNILYKGYIAQIAGLVKVIEKKKINVLSNITYETVEVLRSINPVIDAQNLPNPPATGIE